MELKFDKEMDALLRKAAKSGAAAAPVLDSHLDADEISMFAENALPETARPRVVSHMADCDRCRTILANVIVMNAEDETVEAAAPLTTADSVEVETQRASWLSGLLTTKTLAFGFGALALLFAGFLGFAVIQNLNSGETQLAQADKSADTSSNRSEDNIFAPDTFESANSNAEVLDEDDKTAVDSKESEGTPLMVPKSEAVTGKDTARRAQVPAEDGFADRRDLGRSRENKPKAERLEDLEEDADAAVLSEMKPAPPLPPSPKPTVAEPAKPAITVRGGVARSKPADEVTTAQADKKRKADDPAPPPQVRPRSLRLGKGSAGRLLHAATVSGTTRPIRVRRQEI